MSKIMSDKSRTNQKHLLKVAASKFDLLQELSRGEGFITDLKERTGFPKSQISESADELIEVGLVEEGKKPGQGKKRFIKLTAKARQLLADLNKLEGPSPPEPPPNRELVLAYLEATGPNYDDETRAQAARSLGDLALHKEAEVYEEVRAVFQSVVQKPSIGDVENPLWQALGSALPRMLRRPALRKWAMETLFHPLLEGARNSALPSAARAKCLDLLDAFFAEAAESRPEIVNAAKGVWLEDGGANEPHRQMAKANLHRAYRTSDDMRAAILRWLLEKAKGADERVKKKANELLSFLLATPSR